MIDLTASSHEGEESMPNPPPRRRTRPNTQLVKPKSLNLGPAAETPGESPASPHGGETYYIRILIAIIIVTSGNLVYIVIVKAQVPEPGTSRQRLQTLCTASGSIIAATLGKQGKYSSSRCLPLVCCCSGYGCYWK